MLLIPIVRTLPITPHRYVSLVCEIYGRRVARAPYGLFMVQCVQRTYIHMYKACSTSQRHLNCAEASLRNVALTSETDCPYAVLRWHGSSKRKNPTILNLSVIHIICAIPGDHPTWSQNAHSPSDLSDSETYTLGDPPPQLIIMECGAVARSRRRFCSKNLNRGGGRASHRKGCFVFPFSREVWTAERKDSIRLSVFREGGDPWGLGKGKTLFEECSCF
jgi:hypothetical protein